MRRYHHLRYFFGGTSLEGEERKDRVEGKEDLNRVDRDEEESQYRLICRYRLMSYVLQGETVGAHLP